MGAKDGNASVAVKVTTTPERGSAVMPGLEGGDAEQVTARLLKMTDDYDGERAVWRAMEICFILIENNGNTAEAHMARRRLRKIAEGYERARLRHRARSTYERLA